MTFSISSCRPETLAAELPFSSMYRSRSAKPAPPDSIFWPMPASHEA